MKKITNLLYVLAVLMLVSCNDFLDKSPKYAVDPETTVTDDVAVALTNACYKALQSSNLYNQRMWSLDIVAQQPGRCRRWYRWSGNHTGIQFYHAER